jgi:hypothetical protein
MKASIGRVVHFVWKGGAHYAAVVTDVPEGSAEDEFVSLAVFHHGIKATVYLDRVPHFEAGSEVPEHRKAFHDSHGSNTWHWPERVD